MNNSSVDSIALVLWKEELEESILDLTTVRLDVKKGWFYMNGGAQRKGNILKKAKEIYNKSIEEKSIDNQYGFYASCENGKNGFFKTKTKKTSKIESIAINRFESEKINGFLITKDGERLSSSLEKIVMKIGVLDLVNISDLITLNRLSGVDSDKLDTYLSICQYFNLATPKKMEI